MTRVTQAIQKAKEFIFKEIRKYPVGYHLPPVRQLAKMAEVSVATAHKAIQQLSHEKVVVSKPGSGVFSIYEGKWNEKVTVGINYSTASSVYEWSPWIYQGILKGLSQRNVLSKFFENSSDIKTQLAIETDQELDGFLVLPGPTSEKIVASLEERSVPTILCFPHHENSTKNFVSSDYYLAGYQLGKTWKKCNKKNIVYIGDQSRAPFWQRYSGILKGLSPEVGDQIKFRSYSIPLAEEFAYKWASKNISKIHYPDALFCSSDRAISGILKRIAELKINCPKDLSIVSGMGTEISKTEDLPEITSVKQPFYQIGYQMVQVLLERIKNGGKDVPGVYTPSTFECNQTTTEKENSILATFNMISRTYK